MSNRGEDQKLKSCHLGGLNTKNSGWVFGVQLGLRQTQTVISTYYILHYHYHEEEDVHIELPSPPTPYPQPTTLDKDNLIGTH